MSVGQTFMEPLELPGKNSSTCGGGNIPEIDLSGTADITPPVPEEYPGRGMESWS